MTESNRFVQPVLIRYTQEGDADLYFAIMDGNFVIVEGPFEDYTLATFTNTTLILKAVLVPPLLSTSFDVVELAVSKKLFPRSKGARVEWEKNKTGFFRVMHGMDRFKYAIVRDGDRDCGCDIPRKRSIINILNKWRSIVAFRPSSGVFIPGPSMLYETSFFNTHPKSAARMVAHLLLDWAVGAGPDIDWDHFICEEDACVQVKHDIPFNFTWRIGDTLIGQRNRDTAKHIHLFLTEYTTECKRILFMVKNGVAKLTMSLVPSWHRATVVHRLNSIYTWEGIMEALS